MELGSIDPCVDHFKSQKLSAPQSLRPSITDDGHVIVRAGNEDTSPILLYPYDLTSPVTIAGTDQGFTKLGSNPAITADGKVATFYGELSTSGAAALGLDPGPGIFASIDLGTGRVIVPVAGVAGNGYLDPGETFTENDGQIGFGPGDSDVGTIASFDPLERAPVATTAPGNNGARHAGDRGLCRARRRGRRRSTRPGSTYRLIPPRPLMLMCSTPPQFAFLPGELSP